MTGDQIAELLALRPEHPESVVRYLARAEWGIRRLLEERRRLLWALKASYDENYCWAHDTAGIAYAAIEFAEAPTEDAASAAKENP